MPTNAQTALQAAATVYAGKRPSPAEVKMLADSYKNWLDQQDAAEPEQIPQRETSLDAMVERGDSVKPPEMHGDIREEPMYRRGQQIGFTGR